jgi:hypothetical protein
MAKTIMEEVSIFFLVTEIYSDIRTAFDGVEEVDGQG